MMRVLILLSLITASGVFGAITVPGTTETDAGLTGLDLLFVLDGPGRAAVAAALEEEIEWADGSGESERRVLLEALLAAWNRDGGRNAATLVSRVRLAGSFTAWKAGETLLPVAHPAGKAWSFRGNLRLREARSQYCFVIELSLPDKPAAVVEVRAHDPRAAAFDEDEFGGRVSVLLVDRPPGAVVDPSAGNAEARAFFGEMITLFDKSAQALDAAGSGREAAAAWRAHVAAFRLLEAQGHRLEARFGPLEDLPDSAGLSDLAESLEAALHRFTVLLEAALEKYAGDADFQQAVRELAEEAPCGIP